MANKLISDQMGTIFPLQQPPERIISLVPSLTELIVELGMGDKVVGVTKFCTHGGLDRKKLSVGGTKNPNLLKIKQLNPDWIFANKEENREQDVETLQQYAHVWVSEVKNLADNLQVVESFGTIFAREQEASLLISNIREKFSSLEDYLADKPRPKVAYLIWENPIMVAGGDTFIHDMLNWAGFENVFGDKSRYPTLTSTELANCGADLLFLSSEPYPFGSSHLQKYAEINPKMRPLLADGEFFSWYGSRPLLAVDYFRQLWVENGDKFNF